MLGGRLAHICLVMIRSVRTSPNSTYGTIDHPWEAREDDFPDTLRTCQLSGICSSGGESIVAVDGGLAGRANMLATVRLRFRDRWIQWNSRVPESNLNLVTWVVRLTVAPQTCRCGSEPTMRARTRAARRQQRCCFWYFIHLVGCCAHRVACSM